LSKSMYWLSLSSLWMIEQLA